MSSEFSSLNARSMTTESVVRSFVVPETFYQLTSNDHAFLLGPRGSGKTTLLKMLSCRYLARWDRLDPDAALGATGRLGFTGVFLPTDSLWTTQTHKSAGTMAFACQLLNRIVDAMQFRIEGQAKGGVAPRFPVTFSAAQEVELVKELSAAWGVAVQANTLRSLSSSLDRMLLSASSMSGSTSMSREPFQLAIHGVRAFNRIAGQPDHRWGILIDELEIAPDEIATRVMRLVRGGSSELILKISMSPSDRTGLLTDIGRPMPGHDFVPVHLLSQSMAAKRQFTQVLWHQALEQADIVPASVEASFGRSFQESAREEGILDPLRQEFELALSWDPEFARWFESRGLTLDALSKMDYDQRSAVVRKVYPLLVYRNGNFKITTRPDEWRRRSRKKEFEAFSGASQIINALEGNPRWIKSAFRIMIGSASRVNGQVDAPMQYSALLDVARSFESFLRFIPSPASPGRVVSDLSLIQLVDAVADFMHKRHTGEFTPDPPNSFTVEAAFAEQLGPIIDLGLHSGGIVHLRTSASSGLVNDHVGQRFRLTYLLAVRPTRSFPMRLGRAVNLGHILQHGGIGSSVFSDAGQLQLPWEA